MKIYKTLFALVALFASVQIAAAISVGGYEISGQSTTATNAVACTMDAMLCPDGVTYVGRTGPSCAFAACPSGISPIPPISTCVDLQYNLDVGSVDANTNGEVTKLQKFLYPKYLSVPATGAFYGMTKSAVIKFQSEYGISPAVGFVGAITRAKIKQLTCGGTTQTLAINSLSPSYAKVGETVTLTGPGLNSGNDYVLFDGYRIATDGSKSLNRVGFAVPQYLSHTINCIKAPCPDAPIRVVAPGVYTVEVVNNLGKTNTVNLTVTDGSVTVPPNETIKISWVSPMAAKSGSTVTIYGYNFFRPETRILFGGYSIPGKPVYSRIAGNFNSAFEFVVPYGFPNCAEPSCVVSSKLAITPGTYDLVVDNKYGRDAVKFEVLGDIVSTSPYLNYVNPTQGVVGTEVAVFGRNLNTSSEKVYFGNSQVFPLISSATDQKGVVRFKIPEYITPCGYEDNTACRMAARPVTAGNYEIIVKNNNGLSNKLSFTVTTTGTTVAPKINSVSPSFGLVGTEVAISGERINVGGDKIYFGGALVAQSTTASADVVNVLRFKIPEYITPCGVGSDGTCRIASRPVTAGNYEVVVVNSNGTSNTLSFTVGTSSTNSPTITSLSPSAGLTGTQVTITGTGFTPTGNKVNFGQSGNINGTGYNSTDGKTITFLAPVYSSNTGNINQPGNYAVSVTNANGVSSSLNFTVTALTGQSPVVSSISSTYGTVGTRVTMFGSNIDTGSEYVLFDGFRIATDGAKVAGQVSFLVPEYLTFQCNRVKPSDPCPAVASRTVIPGAYSIAIGNTNGVSNASTFNVITYAVESPLITKFRVEDVATTNSVSRKLVWTTQFASTCTASGAWSGAQPTNGSYSIGFMSQPMTYTLTCRNTQGASVSSSVTDPTGNTTQVPVISSVSPSMGGTGSQVTLSGTNLNPGSDFVWFAGVKLTPDRFSKAFNALTFTVPTTLYQCGGQFCTDVASQPTPLGTYGVRVETDKNVFSNVVNYQVTSNGSGSNF